MPLNPEQQALSFFLPDHALDYFDVVSSEKNDATLRITLEEKNNPPIEKRHRGMSVESKGFSDITITDFCSRGRKTELVFRRRKWKVGSEILKRSIALCSPDTMLEREFGLFLKTDC